jgi:hypothetical protein
MVRTQKKEKSWQKYAWITNLRRKENLAVKPQNRNAWGYHQTVSLKSGRV